MNALKSVALICLLSATLPLQAATTAELFEDCKLYQQAINSEDKNSELTIAKSSGCYRYIDGFKNGLLFNNVQQMAYAKRKKSEKYYSCKIESGTFDVKAVEAFILYVKEHPQSSDMPAATTLMLAVTPLLKCAHQKVGIHYPY